LILELRSEELRVEVDPSRGGVIRSVVETMTGTEILFRAPWPAAPLETANEGESKWTRAWQGGWNALFPNAGNACAVDGRMHPFHGDASCSAWSLAERDGDRVQLVWHDPDRLVLLRDISVEERTLRVQTRVRNEGAAPVAYVLVEHLVLGEELLGPATIVEIADARVVPLADDGRPLAARPSDWPHVAGPGPVEDWSSRPTAPASRFGALHGIADRCVTVRAPERRCAVRISWSRGLPFLWLWEERGGYADDPWAARVVCLGLEPATAPTSEGLRTARARGEAPTLEGGDVADYAVELEVRRA
jgi:hypothetical protein